MARYKCLTKTFIAPYRFDDGDTFTIDDSFIPGPHLEPMDEAAEAAMAEYERSRPNATLEPIEELPNNFNIVPEGPSEAQTAEPTISLAEAASGDVKASPGLDQGGKAAKAT